MKTVKYVGIDLDIHENQVRVEPQKQSQLEASSSHWQHANNLEKSSSALMTISIDTVEQQQKQSIPCSCIQWASPP